MICFVVGLSICTSCNYFSGDKNNVNRSGIDTIVDFSTVDVSPSFKECEDLLDAEKTGCFRKQIREKFAKRLNRYIFSSKEDIDETIILVLNINQNGKIAVENVASSEYIKENLPELSEILMQMVDSIPNLYPAIKRGIPVTTQYKLPIRIQTKG